MSDLQIKQVSDTVAIPLHNVGHSRVTESANGSTMEQNYINCFPEIYVNALSGETEVGIVKRPPINPAANNGNSDMTPGIGSYGTSSGMFCVCNMVMTQLFDVYVAAFWDNASTSFKIVQYRPQASTTTLIGTISSANKDDVIFITEITDSDTLLPSIAISYQKSDRSSGTGYYARTTAGVFSTSSLTQITSVSFPANLVTPRIITGPFQYLNGHSYIMTLDGFIYMASLTAAGNPDITTWNTNATVVASQYPDKGVGLYRYKSFLCAFGGDSVEFFSDVSNPPPGASIERTDQAFIKFGAINPKLIINVDDILYWVAYSATGTVGVWKLDGFVPTKISLPKQDYYFTKTFAKITNALASQYTLEALMLNNTRHLFFNGIGFPTQVFNSTQFLDTDSPAINSALDPVALCLAYNLSSQEWWGFNNQARAGSIMPTTSYGSPSQIGQYQQYFFKALLQDTTAQNQNQIQSTKPFLFSIAGTSNVYFDQSYIVSGILYPTFYCVICQTNTYWFSNSKRKRMNRLSIAYDPGGGSVYYIGYNRVNSAGNADNTILRRYVSGLDMNGDRLYINNMGMGRSLSVVIVTLSSAFERFVAAEIDIQQGTA